MKRVYVLGPSLPTQIRKGIAASNTALIHAPTVRLMKLPYKRQQLCQLANRYDGLILTSKYAVQCAHSFFRHKLAPDLPQTIFCVGKTTARYATRLVYTFGRKRRLTKKSILKQYTIHTATEETQEGVISLIRQHFAPSSRLLWLSSSQARTVLVGELQKDGYTIDQIIAYTPVPCRFSHKLVHGDTLFFSCPSSVASFFSWSASPSLPNLLYKTIGPITEKALQTALQNHALKLISSAPVSISEL